MRANHYLKFLVLISFFFNLSVTGQELKTEATDLTAFQNREVNSDIVNSVKSVSQQRLHDMKGVFKFQQILDETNGITKITNIGVFNYTYTPYETQDLYLNVTVRNHFTNQYAWGVQNLLIPGTNYTTYQQSISVPFPLDIIGYPEGSGFVDLIDYFYEFMANPMTYLPTGNPGTSEVTPFFEQVSNGRVTDLTPPTGPASWYPDSWDASKPVGVTYISCNPEDPKSMPNIDLNEAANTGDDGGCAPAAAANSLNWLKKMHDEINFPADLRSTFNQISKLMRRGDGVKDNNFIKGKVDFAEMYNLPIKVKYQSANFEGPILSSTRRTQAECMDANGTAFPTKEFLLNELKDGEDVEIGYVFEGGGHWVVLNGAISYNDKTFAYTKDDGDQSKEDGLRNTFTRVVVEDGKIKLPARRNGTVDIIVSESYDPNYTPPSTEVTYVRFCNYTERLVPPGYKINITYPDNATRSYCTTISAYDFSSPTSFYERLGVWNFNGNKVQQFKNDRAVPLLLSIHNDDHSVGRFQRQSNEETIYEPYTIDISPAEPAEAGDETSPFNESEYAGFSMGWDNDSAEEFGDSTAATVNFTVETGCLSSGLPRSMKPEGTTELNINYNILEMNKYWSDLEFVLGIVSVETPGILTLSFSNSPVPQTIEITNETRDISIPIGGVQNAGNFSFSISTAGTNTAFTIDNIGVPTNVPMFPSSVEENDITPKEFILMQNYPNPFNPVTSIKYSIPSTEYIQIKVYDVLGREVATLVDEVKKSGAYQVEFDANDLSSGVYFYIMTAGSFSDIKKCVILK